MPRIARLVVKERLLECRRSPCCSGAGMNSFGMDENRGDGWMSTADVEDPACCLRGWDA